MELGARVDGGKMFGWVFKLRVYECINDLHVPYI